MHPGHGRRHAPGAAACRGPPGGPAGDLITPVMHEVGRRWERGEIGVADEHLATSVCEWLLFSIAGRSPRVRSGTARRAVVGCSPGELHTLGALIVAKVLSERGWRVLYLGGSTPTDAWAPIIRARSADVAVLATTTPSAMAHVPGALRTIHDARPDCLTVVGGQAYSTRSIGRAVGAAMFACDVRGLPERLDAALS
ncbi:MAG TPA: cobalamin-dependent protein [Solirubrobacteraceae bacterium]|nr:cobalamin-dependent protein [Solirubrobacteraceae bacterium]